MGGACAHVHARRAAIWERAKLTMPSPPCPHMQVLHLQDGYVTGTALNRYLSATAGTLIRLHLDDMRLCPKECSYPWPPFSWASTLDMIRTHCCPREHRGGGRGDNHANLARTMPAQKPLIVRIRRPRRAEFNDQSLSSSDMAHIRALSEPESDGLGAIDRFLKCLSDRNP